MKKEEVESYLKSTVKRLEKAYTEVVKTQGYTKEAERMRLLYEMAKEQVQNENTHPTAR
jgi:hypothetical protein